ncbi:hypothetical protein HYDPIDRAFT_27597 [Hydnomerulius pinastri MD-312]|nr:hypothetical protein HYDPIDRAFT_27597 [Hydnomerulius pinastri MD-312]
MSAIGSVFLGDFQRHRIISSTPPSSPPPGHDGNTMSIALASSPPLEDVLESVDGTDSPAKTATSLPEGNEPPSAEITQAPTTIDPALSLELRLRWLEALLLGVRQDVRERKGKDKISELKPGESLIHLAEDVQRRLNNVVDSNDGLKKFMTQYDHHAQLLTPAFALSGTVPGPSPTYENMSSEELEALLAEMEPDIRAADRDMREIELLEQRGVLSAGKLADYEALQPRLQALLAAQEEDMKVAASLEKRIASLVERHATHVDALSELFVAWDDVLTETESKVRRLERDKDERQRLGYE